MLVVDIYVNIFVDQEVLSKYSHYKLAHFTVL